jgi:hypothetical protein
LYDRFIDDVLCKSFFLIDCTALYQPLLFTSLCLEISFQIDLCFLID